MSNDSHDDQQPLKTASTDDTTETFDNDVPQQMKNANEEHHLAADSTLQHDSSVNQPPHIPTDGPRPPSQLFERR